MKKRHLAEVVNNHGFFWTKVPKKMRLTEKKMDKYVDKSATWWEVSLNLVLDSVTLTMPPASLTSRLTRRHT